MDDADDSGSFERTLSPLRLQTLGKLSLTFADGSPALGPGVPLAVLTYLYCSRSRSASREHLAELFWGNSDQGKARQALRQNLSRLRSVLGDDAFQDRDGNVIVAIALDCDRESFLSAIEALDFSSAIELYVGPFFPNDATVGGAGFEHWADAERERLHATFLKAGENLVRQALDRAQPGKVVALTQRLCGEAPGIERVRRLLIEVLYANRDQPAALLEADRLLEDLREEGRSPDSLTAGLIRLVREGAPDTDGGRESAGIAAALIGRDREFNTVISEWRSASSGPSRQVHVEGRAGIGKTRLLDELALRLRALGGRVICLRARAGDRSLPGAFTADLVRELCELPGARAIAPQSAAVLVGLHPAIGALFSNAGTEASTEEPAARRALAIADLVSAVAEEAPVAILVDDVHWMDEESRKIVEAVPGRLASARVLWLTAGRPGAAPKTLDADSKVLLLAPLSLADTEELLSGVASFQDTGLGRRVSAGLHRATGGSPLFILESIQLALDEGRLMRVDGTWKVPDVEGLVAWLGERNALEARLGSLSTTARRLLLTLAATGVALRPADIERAAQSGVLSGDTFAELERRGYVAPKGGRWDLAHDEIGEALLRAATPAEQQAAHAALGRALAERWDGDPTVARRSARHLVEGDAQADLARLFREWVKTSRDRGDWVDATRLGKELLGDLATPARTASLVGALPKGLRWRWLRALR